MEKETPKTEKDALAAQRYEKMTRAPVAPLIMSMSLPAIASMLVNSLYNMADTYFVSQIGTSATAAPGIAMPLFQIIQAIALAFAIGAGSYAARALGRRDNEGANRSVSTAFFMAIFVCTLVGAASLVFLRPVLSLFGATDTVLPYAYDYSLWVILATPFFSATFVLSQAIRQEGSVRLAVIGTVAGAVINVVLDPILIFGLNMGIVGAALATSISQIISFSILFIFMQRGKSVVKISWKYFTLKKEILADILKVGSPDFFRTGLVSIAAILLNNAAALYGDVALAGMTVVSRIIGLMLSVLMGFGQGFQPMCGYCYGAKLYKRVLKGFRFTLLTSILVMTACTVLAIALAEPIVGLFNPDPAFKLVAGQILRAQFIALPPATLTIIANMLFQSCGRAMQSGILALSRNGVFFIPLILSLPSVMDFYGVIYSQPFADIITFGIALVMLLLILREFRGKLHQPQGAAV